MPRLISTWRSNLTRALGCPSMPLRSGVFRLWSLFRSTAHPRCLTVLQVPDTSRSGLQDRIDSLQHRCRDGRTNIDNGCGLRNDVSRCVGKGADARAAGARRQQLGRGSSGAGGTKGEKACAGVGSAAVSIVGQSTGGREEEWGQESPTHMSPHQRTEFSVFEVT